MAIYHCSIKIISRGKGQSAVAAAAYRAGEFIKSDYDGIAHDYTRKGGVIHTEILLPNYAPKEYASRSVLWNAVEQVEKAKNSQLAREIELALPAEFNLQQNISLVREYVSKCFVSAGMCADICVHDKNDGNPHAHVMLTMRPFEQNGTWGAKAHKINGRKVPTVDWNERSKVEEWRATWAETCNAFFVQQELLERMDHRSYERQGIEQVPTVHMGVAATQMERKGIATERGNMNREIAITNKQLRQLRARIHQLKGWLREVISPAASPMLIDIIQDVLEQNIPLQVPERSVKRVLDFLHENHISTLPQLRRKVYELQDQLNNTRSGAEYNTLKDQVLAAETVRCEAERILRKMKQPQKEQQVKSRRQRLR